MKYYNYTEQIEVEGKHNKIKLQTFCIRIKLNSREKTSFDFVQCVYHYITKFTRLTVIYSLDPLLTDFQPFRSFCQVEVHFSSIAKTI